MILEFIKAAKSALKLVYNFFKISFHHLDKFRASKLIIGAILDALLSYWFGSICIALTQFLRGFSNHGY